MSSLPVRFIVSFLIFYHPVRHCDIPDDIVGARAPGDIIIGGLFPVHEKVENLANRTQPGPLHCSGFNIRGFVQASAMIYTIDIINNSSLLPGVRLGYEIYDSCADSTKAIKATMRFLSASISADSHLDVRCNYSDYIPVVKAVVGDAYSEVTIPVARIMNRYLMPQISYTASAEILSDKVRFASFFRTIPSDVHQTEALAALVNHFNWNWVGAIATDDDYGRAVIDSFISNADKFKICINFRELIPSYVNHQQSDEIIRKVAETVKKSSTKVIILIAHIPTVIKLFTTLIKQNISKIWIATDGWSNSRQVATIDQIGKVGNIFGLSFKNGNIAGFTDYLKKLNPGPDTMNKFIKEYKKTLTHISEFINDTKACKPNSQSCTLPDSTKVVSSLACTNMNESVQDDFFFKNTQRGGAYGAYLAVKAIANALQKLLNCRKETCDTTFDFPPWKVYQKIWADIAEVVSSVTNEVHDSNQCRKRWNDLVGSARLLKELKNISFVEEDGEFKFNEAGDSTNGYDLLNWKMVNRSVEFNVVGEYRLVNKKIYISDHSFQNAIQSMNMLLSSQNSLNLHNKFFAPDATEMNLIKFTNYILSAAAAQLNRKRNKNISGRAGLLAAAPAAAAASAPTIAASPAAAVVATLAAAAAARLLHWCVQRLHFRKEVLTEICQLIKADLQPTSTNRIAMPVKVNLTAALTFYASGSFQVAAGDICSNSQHTTHFCIHQLTRTLYACRMDFIKYPISSDSQNERAIEATQRYNDSQTAIRNIIERTIGMLKRFRCLDRSGGSLQYAPQQVSVFIVMYCMLHNLPIIREQELPMGIAAPPQEEEEEHEDEEPDMAECHKCPKEQWSHENSIKCIDKTIEILQWTDNFATTLIAISAFGVLIILAMAAIFTKNLDTPAVKAAGGKLCYPILISLVLSFGSVGFFVAEPTNHSCKIRQPAFGISFTLCMSCILVKTFRIILAFRFKPSIHGKLVQLHKPVLITLVGTGIQVIICTLWQVFQGSHPEKIYDIKKIFLRCNEGSYIAFGAMIGYLAILACLCFILAFKGRKLPGNYNDARFIIFSMLIYLIVWISFVIVYININMQGNKYVPIVEIIAILASNYGMLCCHFIPVGYTVCFREKKNTEESYMIALHKNYKSTKHKVEITQGGKQPSNKHLHGGGARPNNSTAAGPARTPPRRRGPPEQLLGGEDPTEQHLGGEARPNTSTATGPA
uniref:G-protein coupled receptor family C group 6 member A-like n=1 Tax=Pristiophorus japonicus TaxID=55135 RepID=UPI00398F866E